MCEIACHASHAAPPACQVAALARLRSSATFSIAAIELYQSRLTVALHVRGRGRGGCCFGKETAVY